MIKLDKITKKYNFNNYEKEEFYNIIKPIYEHKEFQRRLTNEFPHHGSVTLGEHILEVASCTYKFCQNKDKDCDKTLAVTIAMLHDMYTEPWQNNINSKNKLFFNKHGFTHPIEAVINSINYFPELFMEPHKAEILIDGIIHHMYPFPVRVFENNKKNTLELNNFELLKNVKGKYKSMIYQSTKRHKTGKISICKSKFIEGRVVSSCDKKVSRHQIENFSALTSLITGKNKKLRR